MQHYRIRLLSWMETIKPNIRIVMQDLRCWKPAATELGKLRPDHTPGALAASPQHAIPEFLERCSSRTTGITVCASCMRVFLFQTLSRVHNLSSGGKSAKIPSATRKPDENEGCSSFRRVQNQWGFVCASSACASSYYPFSTNDSFATPLAPAISNHQHISRGDGRFAVDLVLRQTPEPLVFLFAHLASDQLEGAA